MSASIAANQTILVVGGQFAIPVTYCSELMSLAYGSGKQAGLDGHIIQPKMQDLTAK